MNLRRPWVILLAGVLSASGSGCAVYNAVTSTSHSSSGPNGTAERFVSIGRTFENQSRYDQAEMMYRKALRIRPNDETIQSHLTQLADRRAGRDFGADSIDRAVAMADAVSGRKTSSFLAAEAKAVAVEAALSGIPEQAEKLVPSNSGTASLNSVELENLPTIAQAAGTIAVEQSAVSTSGRMRISEWSEEETDPAGLVLLSESSADETWDDVAPIPPQIDAFVDVPLPAPSDTNLVSMDQLYAATDDIEANVTVIIRALQHGDSTDTKTLAAALLGDCQSNAAESSSALSAALKTESDQGLLLAIADSQTQRGIADESTVQTLLSISRDATSPHQVQAVSSLRYFAASPAARQCEQHLAHLVDTGSENVRAAAVLTLADFEESAITLTALEELVSDDNEERVREAARAAIERKKVQTAPAGRSSL